MSLIINVICIDYFFGGGLCLPTKDDFCIYSQYEQEVQYALLRPPSNTCILASSENPQGGICLTSKCLGIR